MKSQFTVFISILFLGLFSAFPHPAEASCNLKNIGNATLTDSVCSIDAGTVEGADISANEASTTNTATLTLANSTITINANATLAVGTAIMTSATSSITITASGASLIPGRGIWVDDADADGWALTGFPLYSATASGRRRLGLMRSVSTADCGDTQYATNNSCCVVATRYQDADGDAYGNPNVSIQACTTAGYVDNSTDCNDGDGTKWQNLTGYTDTDGDSYGTGTSSQVCSGASLPSGYAANNTDCNETGTSSANVYISATCYVDSDDDNYGSATSKSCTNNATCGSATWASGANGTAAASGTFSANNTDCHETGTSANLVWASNTCYIDDDGDNWTNGTKTCTNAACASATQGSTGNSTTVVAYTAGDLQTTIGDGSDSNDAQACATGGNPTGACNECVTGAIANQSSSEDVFTECVALDCDGGATKYYSGWASGVCYYKADVSAANAVCDGAGACKTTAVQCAASSQGVSTGVTRTTCKTQVGCTGTTIGSLGNVAAGSDTYSDCVANGTHFRCNGAGACTEATTCVGATSSPTYTCNGTYGSTNCYSGYIGASCASSTTACSAVSVSCRYYDYP